MTADKMHHGGSKMKSTENMPSTSSYPACDCAHTFFQLLNLYLAECLFPPSLASLA